LGKNNLQYMYFENGKSSLNNDDIDRQFGKK